VCTRVILDIVCVWGLSSDIGRSVVGVCIKYHGKAENLGICEIRNLINLVIYKLFKYNNNVPASIERSAIGRLTRLYHSDIPMHHTRGAHAV
jgi:hypothetical protein